MQSTIAFVFLLSLWTISLAADVTIYNAYDYYKAESGTESKPIGASQFPFNFTYHWGDWAVVNFFLKNKSPVVTAMNVTYSTEFGTALAKNDTARTGPRKGEEYYYVDSNTFLKPTAIEIMIILYKSNSSCSPLLVAKGRQAANIPNETAMKGFQYCDIRTRRGCVLVVDLVNKCDGPLLGTERKMNTSTRNTVITVQSINPNNNTITTNSSTNVEITTDKSSAIDTEDAEQQPSQNNVLTYVIPSVIGMCVIILVIYLLKVNKYFHRNSQPVTMELNTYSTANEVVYADLGFVHGDSQPPRRDEESPYAQIVGVLKPADGNEKI